MLVLSDNIATLRALRTQQLICELPNQLRNASGPALAVLLRKTCCCGHRSKICDSYDIDNLTAYATLKIFEDYSEQNLKAVNG